MPVPNPKPKRNPKAPRQQLPLLESRRRAATCEEVALGFRPGQARIEALRCLNCKDPKCIEACPLHIDIKSFISRMADGDLDAAFQRISEDTPFPGICGRVCQHELYCEKAAFWAARRPSWNRWPSGRWSASCRLPEEVERAAFAGGGPANGLKVALVAAARPR